MRCTGRLVQAYWNQPTRNAWLGSFSLRQIAFEREKPLLLEYKGAKLECGYRLDFVVADTVVVEIKAADSLLPIHQSQLLTYMKLGGWKVGLLINFHVPVLKKGIKRLVLGFP